MPRQRLSGTCLLRFSLFSCSVSRLISFSLAPGLLSTADTPKVPLVPPC